MLLCVFQTIFILLHPPSLSFFPPSSLSAFFLPFLPFFFPILSYLSLFVRDFLGINIVLDTILYIREFPIIYQLKIRKISSCF